MTDKKSPRSGKQTAKRSRTKVAPNASQLRHLIDAVPHVLWTTTADGRCDFLSGRWEEYTGVPTDRQLGSAWVEQLHPEDRDSVPAMWRRSVESGCDYQLYCRIRRRDAAYRWFNVRGVPIRDARGRIVKWFGTSTDVHETFEARRALAENEERLRYVQLATHDSVYDWDIRAGRTYRNDQYQRLFGAPAVALDDEDWWRNRLHADDRDRVGAETAAAFRARKSNWSSEYRLMRADGSYAHVVDSAYLIFDAEGRPVRVIGAISDVTEQKRVEQSLRDAQARLLSAIEGGQIATWTWSIEDDRLWWDDAAFKLWGRTREDAADLTLTRVMDFIKDEDRARVRAVVAEFFQTGRAGVIELRPVRRDGVERWLQVLSHIEYDDSGHAVRMAGIYLDITERKRIEESLRDTQGRLESAMAAGELATWIWDLSKDELYWDEAAYRMWGIARDDAPMTSSRVIGLMHPEDQARILAARSAFIGKLDDTDAEFRVVHPDGGVKWLLAKGKFSVDDQGRPIRMVGVYQDITERKRAEEARLSSQKLEALGTLAGGIAHDFNNVLLAISGNAKLALEDIAAGQVDARAMQRSLEEITRASARATDLVKRILTFSRRDKHESEAVLLRPLVEEALRLLRPTLSMQIDIRASFDDTPLVAQIDAIQVHQIIMNLVTNAAHAIGNRGGAIDIRLAPQNIAPEEARNLQGVRPGDYAVLKVSDTGGGIDPEIFGRIFDPFFTTKKPGEGTGLGLAVVHGIVRGHGGAVSVANAKGGGAEFRVYLPLADVDLAASGKHRALPMPGAGEHVLYVDDEEALVFLIARVLERMGYRVTGCIDPEKALQELNADPGAFDVLVTDLAMRGMNGFELTREAQKIRADLPVVMTSGFLRGEDRETAARCDIRELILKPNTVDELGQALDRVLKDIRAKRAVRAAD